jgi:uncharacterized protein YchJ
MSAWSRDTEWQGLEIVATERGGEDDTEGSVEFIARGLRPEPRFAGLASFARAGDKSHRGTSLRDVPEGSIARGKTKGVPFTQRERSRFRREDGLWYYVDGTIKKA